MTNAPRLRAALAGLAAIAVLGLGACTGEDKPATTAPTSAVTTTAAPTSAESTAEQPTSQEPSSEEPSATETTESSESASSTQAGQQTDQSLQAVLQGVELGKPMTPIPLQAMRAQNKGILPTTIPAACAFAGKGVAEPVIDGKPAAMATSADQSAGITVIEMGSEEAAKALLAERDKTLDNPECKSIKLKNQGTEMSATIAAEKTEGYGLEDARIMRSTAANPVTGEKQTRISILGRKGSVIVQVAVPEGDEAAQKAGVEKIVSRLG